MNYKLKFLPSAMKEWKKLDPSIQQVFKKKLKERLSEPHVLASRLSGFECHYKIKLRNLGYRLVYQVKDQEVSVIVIAVGKRDDSIYEISRRRSN